MATLGALALTVEQLELQAKADAEAEKHSIQAIEEAVTSTKQANMVHHYKSTRTHSDTFEITSEDGASAQEKVKAEGESKLGQKSRCGCFGGLFARKK